MMTAILNHLWQSTVVVLVAAMVAAALRNNRASARHAIWLAGSLKFLLPFSILIGLGGAFSWRTASAPALPVAPEIVDTVQTITEPFAPPSIAPAAVNTTPRGVAISWPVVIACVWACGCVAVLVMRVRGWRRIQAALRASTPTTLAGVERGLAVRATSAVLEPGIVGIFRPVLLVPVGLEQSLNTDQLRAVVLHELQHVRRRDNLTSALHMIVETIFWFHPLVWWVGARLIDERERACDEHVIASGEAAPDTYAEGILTVCKRYVESPVACVSGVTGSDLKKRIGAILAGRVGRELSISRKAAISMAAVSALAVPVAAGVFTAPIRTVAFGQTPVPTPNFEVVSVRPCAANEPGSGRGSPLADASPGRLHLSCYTALRMIQTAYGSYADGRPHSESEQPVLPVSDEASKSGMDHTGGQAVPDWVSRDRFTIEAKAETDAPALVMVGPMLQRVLEDRFKIKVHREMREVPVYEMVVSKGGAKLTPAVPGACVSYNLSVSPQPPLEAGKHRCSNSNRRNGDAGYVYSYEAITLDEFAATWSRGWVIDRPIVNKTAMTGLFTMEVEQSGHAGAQDEATAEMMAQFKSRLGLELRPGKGQREFLIIDHIEKPSFAEATGGRPASAAATEGGPVSSQGTAAARAKFDVASIRPCENTPTVLGGRNGGAGPVFSPGLLTVNCMTLEQMINSAYVMNGDPLLNDEGRAGGGKLRDEKTFPQRIRGGPDWMRADRFMIEAKTAVSTGATGREAVPERATMMGPMLRALLEDRFKLSLHRDTQEDVPMYALTVARTGLKIKPAGPDACTPADPNRPEPYRMDDEIATVRKGGKPVCGHGIMGGPVGPNNALVFNGQTMAAVAHFLSGIMDRHVLDKTGLTDQYVIYLEYAPDDQVPYDFLILPRPADPPTAPTIAQVLKTLGLELQPTKGPKAYIVIDHVERPSFAKATEGGPSFGQAGPGGDSQ